MTSISDVKEDMRSIIKELDADGSGFQTKEAVDLLIYHYKQTGLCLPNGNIKPKVQELMRLGAIAVIEEI